MSAERYTFDTNVLFYALDASSPSKHSAARSLIAKAAPDRCLILLQTLAELCNTSAKKRRDLLPQAQDVVLSVQTLFRVSLAAPDDVTDALTAHRAHGLPFWDAMLWATARRAGCTLVLSEDFQDGRTLGGVTFRNPFRMDDVELAGLFT